MAVDSVEGEGDFLVHAIALGAVRVFTSDHAALDRVAFHDSHAALVTDGVAAAGVQGAAGLGFIETAVRVVRQHGVTLIGADSVDLRGKDRLVIIGRQRCRHILLDERPFAAAFAAGTDLECERHGIAASTHPGGQRLADAVLIYLDAAIRGVVLDGDAGDDTGTQRGRFFLNVAYTSAVCAVFGAEACRTSAAFSAAGSSLPRFSARRSIPRQAFGLKEYLSGTFSCKIEDNKYTPPSLCDSPALRGIEDAPGERIIVSHDLTGSEPFSVRRHRNICRSVCDFGKALEDLPEVKA